MSAVPIRGSAMSTAARWPSGEIRTEPTFCACHVESDAAPPRSDHTNENGVRLPRYARTPVLGHGERAIAKRPKIPDLVGDLYRFAGEPELRRVESLRQ